MTKLAVPRDVIITTLEERIAAAPNASSIKTAEELHVLEAEITKWRKYNETFLRKAFTTTEFESEYSVNVYQLNTPSQRYYDVQLRDLVVRARSIIDKQKTVLLSILDRLPLLDADVPAPITNASLTDILKVIHRFPLAANQLRKRHDGRPTLEVNDEYDVQDLLHTLLRIFFDDIRTEEPTPSHAGSGSRLDFFLPAVETVVETKMMRKTLNNKRLADEIAIDIERYRSHGGCKRLVCMVYDPDHQLTNPRGFETGLSGDRNGLTVQTIVIP